MVLNWLSAGGQEGTEENEMCDLKCRTIWHRLTKGPAFLLIEVVCLHQKLRLLQFCGSYETQIGVLGDPVYGQKWLTVFLTKIVSTGYNHLTQIVGPGPAISLWIKVVATCEQDTIYGHELLAA